MEKLVYCGTLLKSFRLSLARSWRMVVACSSSIRIRIRASIGSKTRQAYVWSWGVWWTPSDCGERLLPAATLPTANAASSPSARDLPLSPRIKRREIVATLGNAHEFDRLLVARTWELGMFQSERKGFVVDDEGIE